MYCVISFDSSVGPIKCTSKEFRITTLAALVLDSAHHSDTACKTTA